MWVFSQDDPSPPPLYEEPSVDKQSPDEDEPTEPPAEPARFGWAQGVMVRTFKIAQKNTPDV